MDMNTDDLDHAANLLKQMSKEHLAYALTALYGFYFISYHEAVEKGMDKAFTDRMQESLITIGARLPLDVTDVLVAALTKKKAI